MDHIGWLLEADGTVRPVIAARRLVWPGAAIVTYHGGGTEVVRAVNVLSRDDLDVRFDFTEVPA